ncbi:MAG TPA: hypothetical protein VF647_23220 [Longimicrobium sp.]|jgi:hypothetical protein
MAYREFTDPAGVVWRAWDTYPSSASNVRSVYASGWLGFESPTERRRLHPVPDGWAEAEDDTLCAWLRAAVPVKARQTEEYLNQARGGATPSEAPAEPPTTDESQNAQTRTALMDATRAVVERARSVIRVVSNTLGHPDDDKGGG